MSTMNRMEEELSMLNNEIGDLESQISDAERRAEANIQPLKDELAEVKRDKTLYASKNDSDMVSECIRKEDNLKFKISSQWNESLHLKDELTQLKKQKKNLEYEISLEKDKQKRKNQVLAQMNIVLDNYTRKESLRQAAIDSGTNPDTVEQWMEWGRNDFNETSAYFYKRKVEIDEEKKKLEAEKLLRQMDDVINAYKKTGSLKQASRLANVSYDTVMYWHEWGSRGFGEENTYFYKKIKDI